VKMSKVRNKTFIKTKAYKMQLINEINKLMRQHNRISASDFVRIAFRVIGNDDLEAIKIAMELEIMDPVQDDK
jgi:hypothetical protein